MEWSPNGGQTPARGGGVAQREGRASFEFKHPLLFQLWQPSEEEEVYTADFGGPQERSYL